MRAAKRSSFAVNGSSGAFVVGISGSPPSDWSSPPSGQPLLWRHALGQPAIPVGTLQPTSR